MFEVFMERIWNKLKTMKKMTVLLFSFLFIMGCGYEVNAAVDDGNYLKRSSDGSEGQSLVGVFEIGSFVRLKQDLNLRAKPGGEKVAVLLKNQEAQIISFFKSIKGDRYYQIYANRNLGYIFAGDETTYTKFVEQTWRSKAKKFLAKPGDRVRIKNPFGLGVRLRPGSETKLTVVPPGIVLTVQSIIQGKDSKVYYKVKHRSYKGYIYSGNLEKKKKVLAWTKVL